MKEYKELNKISKGLIEKKHRKTINSLCCLEEKKDVLKFTLVSHLKLRHLELEEFINESKDHEDFELIYLKSSLIPSKIVLLQENFQEKDFKKILTLLEELELRLLNNGSI